MQQNFDPRYSGYGGQNQAGAGYGSPGQWTPRQGTPGQGTPGQGAPNYGAAGYGMPQQEPPHKSSRISSKKQWKLLLRQYGLILLSDKKNLIVSLLFPVLAAVITVWIAGENMFVHYEGTKSGNFVLVSAAIWGGLFNSIQTVVRERANIKRDFVTGLNIECYTASRALLQFFLCCFQSLVLCLSYLGVSGVHGNRLPGSGIILPAPMIEYYISLLLLMFSADMMGLMISCIVKKTETANTLAPYILIVQLIFSGILFEMTGLAEKVSYFMISRWGMEALGSISELNDLPLRMAEEFPILEHEAEEMFEAEPLHLLGVWLILLVFIAVCFAIGDLLLHHVSKDSR